MSHFTRIQTQFADAGLLERALADVRQQFSLGVVRTDTDVRGYRGITAKADLVVATHSQGYDIGFCRTGDTFEMVADWYGISDIRQEELQSALLRRYAYHAVRQQLDKQGFTLVEERVEENQAVHLVLRRTV